MRAQSHWRCAMVSLALKHALRPLSLVACCFVILLGSGLMNLSASKHNLLDVPQNKQSRLEGLETQVRTQQSRLDELDNQLKESSTAQGPGVQATLGFADAKISAAAEPSEKPPLRVLMFGYNHTKKFWSRGFMEDQLQVAKNCSKIPGLRSCEWFADPDIPDDIDSFIVMAGTPGKSPILRHELATLYPRRYGKKAHHIGQFYTEAYPQYQPKAFRYSVSIVGDPQVRVTDGCKVYERTIAMLKSGELNLSSAFDRPKGAATFISNCGGSLQRINFLKNVSKHYRIDHRGVCLNNVKIPKDSGRKGKVEFWRSKELHARQYKFLFALENKQFKYYVSEKVFNGLAAGSIPIYYGASLDEVSEFMPPNSFIYIPTYSDEAAKGLADDMHLLEQNRSLFQSYFQWGLTDLEALYRKHRCERAWQCQVCDYLSTVNTTYPGQSLEKSKTSSKHPKQK